MKAISFIFVFTLSAMTLCGQTKSIPVIINCTLEMGDSVLSWTATENSLKVTYVVQQFRWNKWVNWDTIEGKSKGDTTKYSANIAKYFHSNENVFRVNPKVKEKVIANSQNVKHLEKNLDIQLPRLVYYNKNAPMDVTFNKPTWFEVYNKFGTLLIHGYGISFSRKGFPRDVYYVNYDNACTEVIW